VCEYAGEVLGELEAELRNQQDRKNQSGNYIYWIRENFGDKNVTQTIVDPTTLGNIGRYLNHSCDPNLVACPVRIDCLVPTIAFFATRSIQREEELTFDYGVNSDNATSDVTILKSDESLEQLTLCLCHSKNCRGKLPFHVLTNLS
jgi:histone-lysine N-methyltransferase SETMAR